MSNTWLRLYHEMPTNPKWRVIARKSGKSIPFVIAVAVVLLISASKNTVKRGVTQCNIDDVSATLDVSEDDLSTIVDAMQGKFINGPIHDAVIINWEEYQPKREDSSTERVRKHRETQRNAVEHNVTLDKTRPDQRREDKTPLTPQGGDGSLKNGAGVGLRHVPGLSSGVMVKAMRRAKELNRDYGQLCETYNAWISKVGAPGNLDAAFPAWIEDYTKGERL